MCKISFIFILCLFSLGISSEKTYWNEQAIRTITHIDEDTLVLDDGSEWAIGYWWEDNLRNWKEGEIVQFVVPTDIAYYSFQIDNLNRDETIWSSKAIKQPDMNQNCLWIYEIKKIENGYLVILNNGLAFEMDKYGKNWQSGDVITVIKRAWPDNKPAIYHHNSCYVISTSSLKIINIPVNSNPRIINIFDL